MPRAPSQEMCGARKWFEAKLKVDISRWIDFDFVNFHFCCAARGNFAT